MEGIGSGSLPLVAVFGCRPVPCYFPLRAWRAREPSPSGKYPLTWDVKKGWEDLPVSVPCGRCVGCRLERSRQWAVRCVQESLCHEENCFITLTYRDDNLPPGGTLVKSDFQLFMKRLRKRFNDRQIRFFHCGEYGKKLSRPHYHAILFGFDFPDKAYYATKGGNKLYTSAILSGGSHALWPHGYAVIGEATFDSAAYVARYCLKKVNGKDAEAHYQGKVAEYVTMSRGGRKKGPGGIGAEFYRRFRSDVYPRGYTVVRGIKMAPPKFYDGMYEADEPEDFRRMKVDRAARSLSPENEHERLLVRRKVLLSRMKQTTRSLEE